jgi:hypothetical protein
MYNQRYDPTIDTIQRLQLLLRLLTSSAPHSGQSSQLLVDAHGGNA